MSCLTDLNITGLSDAIGGMESKINGLAADDTKGIAANISSLRSDLLGEFSTIKGKLDEIIPAVPDLPKSLQADFKSLSDSIGSADFVGKLTELQSNFGSALDDVLADLPAGIDSVNDAITAIAGGSLDCSLVKNLELTSSGEIIEKGIAGTLAKADGLKEPTAPSPKTLVEVTPVITVAVTIPETETVAAAKVPIIPSDAVAIDTWCSFTISSFPIGADKQPMKLMKVVIPGVQSISGVIPDKDFLSLRRVLLNHDKSWRSGFVDKWNTKYTEFEAASDAGYLIKLNYFRGSYNKDSMLSPLKSRAPIEWATNIDVASLSEKRISA